MPPEPNSADAWVVAMASRLAHLKDADEVTVWAAIPGLFHEVFDKLATKVARITSLWLQQWCDPFAASDGELIAGRLYAPAGAHAVRLR